MHPSCLSAFLTFYNQYVSQANETPITSQSSHKLAIIISNADLGHKQGPRIYYDFSIVRYTLLTQPPKTFYRIFSLLRNLRYAQNVLACGRKFFFNAQVTSARRNHHQF